MVAASILPITIHNGELLFLFGKENDMENSAPGWSDFGGAVESNESIYKAALREGSEELTGFLGTDKDLAKLIKKNGGFYKLKHNTYHIHIFFMDYDENLPYYYNKNHHFIWNRITDHKMLSDTRIFEKIEIDWFSIDDLKNLREEFRNFYRNIIDILLGDIENIRKFILSKKSLKNNRISKNKTIRNNHKKN
jgi:hypothetical protein